MNTKKDKVYCIDCVYVHNSDKWGLNNDWCHKVLNYKDTPMKSEEVHAVPLKHNKHNKCPYYKKKSRTQKLLELSPYAIILIIILTFGVAMLKELYMGG